MTIRKPTLPKTYMWRFVHSYDLETTNMIKFCEDVLDFIPHELSFRSFSSYDDHGKEVYDGYIATIFTLRTEEDAFALQLAFGEYQRIL